MSQLFDELMGRTNELQQECEEILAMPKGTAVQEKTVLAVSRASGLVHDLVYYGSRTAYEAIEIGECVLKVRLLRKYIERLMELAGIFTTPLDLNEFT